MTTPPDTSSVPSTSVSSSPRIRADHSPVRLRQSTGSDSNDLSPRARLSPTLSRSYNPNDPDVRERQRTMDADMAIQLSRARGNTVSISPVVTSPLPLGSPSADGHLHFPNLSLAEQHELDAARGVTPLAIDVDNAPQFQASPRTRP
ncbi:hypothetical protein A0H81_09725 [Grifola frondosa]|uniref:Uncharacterized protein n=1 Tax=Grifola frondosa TaxID=5627 RepID=A0A1C7M1C6_GRIFR|nr:hypothetical protein A0H81_09725 [Grifola frondosa]